VGSSPTRPTNVALVQGAADGVKAPLCALSSG
jgi:hypothetical protein